MKATCTWKNKMHSIVDNARGHEIPLDLPPEQGGDDQGATALELVVMGLAGCIVTIFALVAQKSKLTIEELQATVEAEKDKTTLSTVTAKVQVKSPESTEKLQRVLDKTMQLCPVGNLIEKAGIDIPVQLEHRQ